MKKTLTYQFITSLLLLVILSIGESWGLEQVFDFRTSSAASALDVTAPATTSTGNSIDGKSTTQSPITISFSKGTGSNPVFWHTSTSGTYQVRVYNYNSLTISAASGYKINSITASGSGTGGTSYWQDEVILNGGVKNVSITSYTFNCIKSTVEINTITVTYSADTYTITLDGNGQTTSGTADVTATYNSATLSSITNPQKTHFDFDGFYTGSGGTGSKVIDANGVLQANVTGYTGAGGVWTKTSNTTLYAKWIEHSLTNYRTSCCLEIDAINGAVSFTNPTTAVVTWDIIDHVDSWTLEYSSDGGSNWTTAFNDKTSSDSQIEEYDSNADETNDRNRSIINNLSCNTSYLFRISANPESRYCDQVETLDNGGSGYNSGKWNVDYTMTYVQVADGVDEGDNACGDFSVTFEPTSAAYSLPSTIAVTIGGTPATSGTDFTWDDESGELSISASKVTGDIAVTIAGELLTCSNNPSIGAASLTGTFNLSTIGVTVGTSSTGSEYCAWTDYGFVWSSSSSPALNADGTAPSGVNKVQVGTSDNATTWSGSLTGEFEVGTTYYFRAYGKNSKDAASYAYSSADAIFIPRSVTFNSNGGSEISTVYVNSGGTVTAPLAPSKTGYTFSKWQLNGEDYDFSSTVTGNITLDAVWTALEYLVTFDKQGGKYGYNDRTVTFGQDMPSLNRPSRDGYTFAGYFDETNGEGKQYYNADGSSAAQWDKPNATTLYAYWTAESYTITLNNEGADTGKEGTDEIAVTFDSNTNLSGTPAIEKPIKTNYCFSGYYTSEDGEGVQIIDANGNVIANANDGGSPTTTYYTDESKNWKYPGNITLYAYWRPLYTVTWSVNGNETTVQVAQGDKVSELPTAPISADCDDFKKFVGWRATSIDGTSISKPSGIFTTQAGSPAIDANVTFYAVFADVTGGEYTRVTKTSQLANNIKIIMGYEETAKSGVIIPIQSTSYGSSILIPGTESGTAGYGTIDMSSISYSDGVNYRFTLHSGYNSGYWAFEMSGEHVGKYIGHKGRNAVDKAEGIQTDDKTDFSIEIGTNDVATITNKYGNENATVYSKEDHYYKYLRYNANNGSNPRAAIYEEGQNDVVLYISHPLDTANYVTTCATCTAEPSFNNTPAISAIACEGATISATGGLATLGEGDGCHIREYGFVWGTSTNPTIESNIGQYEVDENIAENTTWSYGITELTKGTHYYVRAYAVNKSGIAYSEEVDFWTQGVSSIAITTAPTRTNYIVGETFDPAGMVVTATMISEAEVNVTSDISYSTSALSAGTNQDFSISYTLCEDEETANQKINVYTLAVSEGENAANGTLTYSAGSGATFTISSLTTHWTAGFSVTNGEVVANGDGSYNVIPNGSGNVSVTVNYREASKVKAYYAVNGVILTDLTEEVYESEIATLPDKSALTSAMSSQGVPIFEHYPNFVGWIATPFYGQTSEPAILTANPTITSDITYHAVFTNLEKKSILPTDFSGTSYDANNGERTIDGLVYEVSNMMLSSGQIQIKSTPGYLYNTTPVKYLKWIEVIGNELVVNACSDDSGTKDGSDITPSGSGTAISPYTYTFSEGKKYFKITGQKSTSTVSRINIYYSSARLLYVCQTRDLTTGGNWNIAANWSGSVVPNINEVVRLQKMVTINVANAQAADIILDQSESNEGKIEIAAGKALLVNRTIRTYNGSAYGATQEDDIFIASDGTNGTGALTVGEESTETKATVQFYTKAKKISGVAENRNINQYFGIPVERTSALAYYGAYLYHFNVEAFRWDNIGSGVSMDAFEAYNIKRNETTETTFEIGGTLNLPGTTEHKVKSLSLYRDPADYDDTDIYGNRYNTTNMFANSWSAPIDITAFDVENDFVNAEATIYIYTAGTQTQAESQSTGANKNSNPGQWLVLPVSSVKAVPGAYLTVIPSQQAFMVEATGDPDEEGYNSYINLDYERLVYTPIVTSGATIEPTRAPRRSAREEEEMPMETMQIRVQGESGYGDRVMMHIREDFSTAYENGYDGKKMFDSPAMPYLYALTGYGPTAVNCVPTAEGTVIAFEPGTRDNLFTFTFDYDGEEVWYLNDLVERKSTRIINDNTYPFYMYEGEEAARFVISATPISKTPTELEEGSDGKDAKARKVMVNGTLYILRAGRVYDATGAMVK